MITKIVFFASTVVLCSLLSCGGAGLKDNVRSAEQINARESTGNMVKTQCFENISGQDNRDSSLVYLEIKGQEVNGLYSWLPYQKDRRKGIIKGTLKGNLIKATWKYMQEGMTDSLPVEFKMTRNKLFQKDYSTDPKTGRQFISDTSTFSIKYLPVQCR